MNASEKPVLFEPKWAVPPGELITEYLEDQKFDAEWLSRGLGMSLEDTKKILMGITPINTSVAVRLSELLGRPQHFWLRLETQYTEWLAKHRLKRGRKNEFASMMNALEKGAAEEVKKVNTLKRAKQLSKYLEGTAENIGYLVQAGDTDFSDDAEESADVVFTLKEAAQVLEKMTRFKGRRVRYRIRGRNHPVIFWSTIHNTSADAWAGAAGIKAGVPGSDDVKVMLVFRKKKAKADPSLIPADKEQCQAEIPNGNSFMTLGGSSGRARCTKKPSYVVTELEPGEDGKCGSMSLCDDCLSMFQIQEPEHYKRVRLSPIEKS